LNEEEKILLILDLDETLIHATENELQVACDFKYLDYFIYKRPYLSVFLDKISKDFRLAIWSSASDEYVEDIVRLINPKHIEFEFIWGRSRCTLKRDYILDSYVQEKRMKKIKKQGYSLEKSLIVDDSPEKTKDNYGNAIYIKPFEGDVKDRELELLSEFLITLKSVDNVRRIEKRGWRNF